ncbi:two-component system, NarL family, sensor histidine kinase DesK [Gracilibacillus ureilyticus]|uniref:histidine kinase n=1 Tax=Gracilibacillus ureilyticus TaxID=531814 RepID=A0A1H9V588_9BACI|nr:two-component system, NarL family, sensor histidine kinase DesK [Gracilibacillus ureilyticus]
MKKIYPRDQIKQYLLIDVISIVFLCYIILREQTVFGLFGNLLLLALFLLSFYIGLWYRDWRLLAASLSGLFVLTLFGVFVSSSILLFGFIFADLIGRARSKWHIGFGIAAIAIMFSIVAWKSSDISDDYFLLPVLILQLVFPILIHIKEKSNRLQGELDAANIQIEKYIQEEERQRIARDIHDTLGQTLTMIKLKSELTTRLIDKDVPRAREELNDILVTARSALKQVRELVSDMKFISLQSELDNAEKLMNSVGIECKLHTEKLPLLSSVTETMIALSVRESVTNVIRHSRASCCTIAIEVTDRIIIIRINDNGIGLNDSESGNGIQSIKERMQLIKGTATISNSSSGGTEVKLNIPYHGERKEKHIQ